jgi:dipeptidyl aminopeptidase/acylaminoacyl peptidase
LFFIALVVGLSGCQYKDDARRAFAGGTGEAELPPATPGLELQSEDYVQVRQRFRTRLLRKGPAPQSWRAVQPPRGVSEIEYHSCGLRLRAWVNRPAGEGKRPAVLFLHGGWAFGKDDWYMARPFREAGFVVMTPMLGGENGQPGSFTLFYDEVDDVLGAADCLARLPGVDPTRLYLAGHSAGGTLTLLAAMSSDRFRAAASLSGSPDQIQFVRTGFPGTVPFDTRDVREYQVRSPIAYATSFKCPTRLYYGSREYYFDDESRRTALLAKSKGLDVEAVVVPGDHMSSVPGGLRQAIKFFREK